MAGARFDIEFPLPTRSARSRMPPRPSPEVAWSKLKPLPSSVTFSSKRSPLRAGTGIDPAGPAGGPRCRSLPLGDPVDDQLDVRGQARRGRHRR